LASLKNRMTFKGLKLSLIESTQPTSKDANTYGLYTFNRSKTELGN